MLHWTASHAAVDRSIAHNLVKTSVKSLRQHCIPTQPQPAMCNPNQPTQLHVTSGASGRHKDHF